MNNQWRDNANKMVVWADETYDYSRVCDICHSKDCAIPLHPDYYKEIGEDHLQMADGDIPSDSYWDWMDKHHPRGSSVNGLGETIVNEHTTANPDLLSEVEDRSSGISVAQNQWMKEAYELLTPKQKMAWGRVMREQIPVVAVAAEMGVTGEAVTQMLNRAKKTVEAYLRSKENEIA